MAVIALIAIPVLPFNILYVCLMLRTNRKENFVMYPCIAIIAFLCTKLGAFLEETTQIAVILIKGLMNSQFVISAYGQYSVTSWILLTALSFVIASYAVKRIRYNHHLEKCVVSSLERKYTKNGGNCFEYSY